MREKHRIDKSTKIRKGRVIGIMLSLVMVMSLIPSMAFAETETGWDGTTKTEPEKVGNVYQIGTASELAYFTEYTMGTANDAVLTADIDMNNKPMKAVDATDADFDGQNHSIENINMTFTSGDASLFSDFNTVSNIRDLTGTMTVNGSGISYVGSFGAFPWATSITNCTSSLNITILNTSNTAYVGGIAARFDGAVDRCTFKGTIDASAVSNTAYIGGIEGNRNTSIKGCVNSGIIMGGTNSYVGGISGFYTSGSITSSYVTAALSGKYVGGLVGQHASTTTYSAPPISNCYSAAVLSGITEGILGFNGKAALSPSLTNVFYLSDQDAGNEVTASYLKGPEVIGLLNNGVSDSQYQFVQQSGTYPRLGWQAAVPVTGVSISGDRVEGGILSAVATGQDGESPTGLTYQWQVSSDNGANFADIEDATGAVFNIPQGYAGKLVKVIARGTDDSEATSASTDPIAKSDLTKINEAKDALTLDYEQNVRREGQIALPPTGANDCAVTWASDNTDVIANDGTVTLPVGGTEDVILTANITSGSESDTKTFTYKVYSQAAAKDELESEVFDKITTDKFSSKTPGTVFNPNGIEGDFILPDSEGWGLSDWDQFVTEVTSNDNTITIDGNTAKVNRPYPYAKNVTLTVTVRHTGNTAVTASKQFALKVAPLEMVDPESISLDRSSIAMIAGTQAKLTASVQPINTDKTTVWTSSNGNVAAVNAAGMITATGQGTAVITAATVNGRRATCQVTVTFGIPSVKVTSSAYNKILVRWSSVAGAGLYDVYRSTKARGTYVKVGSTNGLSYSDSKVNPGTAYYYKVAAGTTAAGKWIYSSYSAVKSAKPILKVPAKVKAKAARRAARLSWRKVSGASGYVVYRATKKKGKYKRIKTVKRGKTVRFTNKKLVRGKTYYYKVRAYRTVKGKKVYSKYSRIVKVRAR